MVRAQNVLGRFQGDVEERTRLRYNEDEFRMDMRWVFPGEEDDADTDEDELIARSRKRRRIDEPVQNKGIPKSRRWSRFGLGK